MSFGVPRVWYEERPRRMKKYGKSKTKSEFVDQCNINLIVKSFKRTGLVQHVAARPGFFMDVSQAGDYKTVMDNVAAAKSLFQELPARTRTKFNNDEALFLDWCVDPANTDEMIELGLLPKDDRSEASGSSASLEGSDKPVSGASEAPEEPAEQ